MLNLNENDMKTVEVKINGYTYYADLKDHVLYEDKEKQNCVTFLFLTENEKKQLNESLRNSH